LLPPEECRSSGTRVETNLFGRLNKTRMEFIYNNPLVVGFVALLLGFVLFMYLFIRRTITGFREGMDNGRQ